MFINTKNIWLLGLCLLILLGPVCLLEAFEDKVVAIVNNDVITQEELDTYISFLQMQMSQEDWQEYALNRRKALENLIEDRLIWQEAQKRNVGIERRLVEQRIDRIKSGFSSEDEFLAVLQLQGMSLSELRNRLSEQLLINKFISLEIRNRILVSPKEVTQYYQQNKEIFKLPEQVLVESIFVEDKDTADKAYEELRSGSDFTAQQNMYSVRESMGLVSRGQLRKELEDAIFGMKAGEFSEPFSTGQGYYIFMVKERAKESVRELVEVQTQISDLLLNMKYNMRLKSFIETLKRDSYISVRI